MSHEHKQSHECCSEEKHKHAHDCACEKNCNTNHEHEHHHHHDESDDCDDAGCCCHHHHEHGEAEENILPKIIISAAIFVAAIIFEKTGFFSDHKIFFDESVSLGKIASTVMYMAAYIICGHGVISGALKNISRGMLFDEEFLMTVASLGAVAVGEYPEAVAVMLLYNIGEYLQDKAVRKSRSSVKALLDIRPDKASVIRNGVAIDVKPEEVAIGEIIFVKAGERVPCDGIVRKGKTFVDMSALSGESVPVEILEGENILSGAINTQSVMEIEVTKTAENSAAAKIIRLAQEASKKKASAEKFITRFSKIYTPIVCAIALLVAIVPPLLIPSMHGEWRTWIYRALTFLVVSCPCAFVISVPLTFFSGIGAASKNGILVKSGVALERLANVGIAVFDKTGTLTKGAFVVSDIHLAQKSKISSEELLQIATHAEMHSLHPISKSLKEAHHAECCQKAIVENAEEIAGQGIKVKVNGQTVLAGTLKLMEAKNVANIYACQKDDTGTIVHIAIDGEYAGHIIISDTLKDDSIASIAKIKKMGVQKIVMLTGDNEKTASAVAALVGADVTYANLLPEDKVRKVDELLLQLGDGTSQNRKTLFFVGDGINDAPVLARADVGIAMGALGSEAAIESADVVIMADEQSKIADALHIAKSTMRIVKQNVVFAFAIKLLIMLLSAFGIANMWLAVFGDTGVALLATVNAVRLVFKKKKLSN